MNFIFTYYVTVAIWPAFFMALPFGFACVRMNLLDSQKTRIKNQRPKGLFICAL